MALLAAASAQFASSQETRTQDWVSLDRQAEELYNKGDLKEAIRVARLAVDAASDPKQSGRSLDRLGFFEYTSGNLKDGESFLRQALELRKNKLGSETADFAESANDLALFCRDAGKLPEARMLAEEAVAIRSRVLGAEHIRIAESLNTLGSIFAGDLPFRASPNPSRIPIRSPGFQRRIRNPVHQPRRHLSARGEICKG